MKETDNIYQQVNRYIKDKISDGESRKRKGSGFGCLTCACNEESFEEVIFQQP